MLKIPEPLMTAPLAAIAPNTIEYERLALVKPTGFREYDARWLFGTEINLNGIRAVGRAFGTLLHDCGITPQVVTGHDFRAYSGAVKDALIIGLMDAGLTVHDIGLALSPMAYFAQFALSVPAVAMVTASHNENGWTGFKLGMKPPITLGPDEMAGLKDLVLKGKGLSRPGGRLVEVSGMAERYIADVAGDRRLANKLKVVCACGNGTAGAFAPEVLERIGCEVVPLDCTPDHSFPRYNPNPEDVRMLAAMAEAVAIHKADLALGFDGDGDRCGIVDNEGNAVFADKVGVLIARDIAAERPGAIFIADVKSTSLYEIDPVLKAKGAKVEYWKTGHSYMKRRVHEAGAAAGFEKSGHYFFAPPYGRGYDDGLVSGVAICRMLDRAGKPVADLVRDLTKTWSTPTMSPHCADEMKYGVVDRVIAHYRALSEKGEKIAGRAIRSLSTVNGIRITLDDGTWGLVRASSNKPELVVVCESPSSEQMMRAMFGNIDSTLSGFPEIGAYNQKI
jgi:phosphomannomutase / phosphoglucomutase